MHLDRKGKQNLARKDDVHLSWSWQQFPSKLEGVYATNPPLLEEKSEV